MTGRWRAVIPDGGDPPRRLRPLGRRQEALLFSFWRLSMMLISASDHDPVIRSLERRGLIVRFDSHGGRVITADGLRAIAAIMDRDGMHLPPPPDGPAGVVDPTGGKP